MRYDKVELEQVNGKLAHMISEGKLKGCVLLYVDKSDAAGYYRSNIDSLQLMGLLEVIKKALIDEYEDEK